MIKINLELGFCTIIFLIISILKICNLITWSWLYIFMPILIPLCLLAILYLIYYTLKLAIFVLNYYANKKL